MTIAEKVKESKYYQKFCTSKFYKLLKRFIEHKNVKYVLFLYFVSFCLFAYTLINNYFVIPLNGDFYLQEIPFYYNGYDDWWSYLTTGEFVFWDENTNLGVNNIGSNSFYYLLNIFFLPTLLVPRSLVPQMQAFLIITKLVLAGYCMKRLLNDCFNISEDTSKLIGVCYAFCGWNLYYLWFNHFLEISVLFPLVLYGVEQVIQKRKISSLILSLILSALTNYFFFIMICFCTVIYAVFRYFQSFPKYDNKDKRDVILLGVSSYAVGLIMSLVILLPCFYVAMQSSRAGSSSYVAALTKTLESISLSIKHKDINNLGNNLNALIKNMLYFNSGSGGSTSNVSNMARVYLYPLASFFYPVVSCSDHLIINNTGYDNALSSLFVFTPVMLMLIPSILQSFKERKISHIVAILGSLILIFTPFAYYCFSGFTNVCYGRWQLFPVVCLLIYAAINLDKRKELKGWYFDISIVFCLIMEIVTLVLANKLQGTSGVNNMDVDAKNVCYAQMAYLVCLYIYFRWKKNSKDFLNNLTWATAIEALVSFNLLLGFTINVGNEDLYVGFFGTQDYEKIYGGKDSVKLETKLISKIKEEDESFYRVYNTSMMRDSNNLGMVEGYNGMGTFHSIYNYEIDDFAMWTHYKYNNSWSMGAHEKKANMDAFLNVKYYLTNKDDTNIPFGYSKYLEEGDKVVYKNDDYIPLGFNFSSIVNADYVNNTLRKWNSSSTSSSYYKGTYTGAVPKAEALLTNDAILYEEDIEEILEKYPQFTSSYHSSINFSTYFNDKVNLRLLNNSEVKIQRAIWNDGPGGDGKYVGREEPVSYSLDAAKALKWNSLVTISFNEAICPLASENNKAYITLTARMGENLVITFKDSNGNTICSDNHMKNTFNKSGDIKFERGFYVDRPVKTIEILVKDTFKSDAILCKPNITYQYYSSYKQNMDKLKQTQFTNIVRKNNLYQFDSSCAKDMISVLSIPYDTGWSLTRINQDKTKEEVKIYKGQGGFVSFVNEKGNCTYKLTYQTPYLSLGLVGFVFGAIIFAGLYYSLEVFKEDKKYLDSCLKFTD